MLRVNHPDGSCVTGLDDIGRMLMTTSSSGRDGSRLAWPTLSEETSEAEGRFRRTRSCCITDKRRGGREVKRKQLGALSIAVDGSGDLSALKGASPVTTGSLLRELCH